MRGVRPRDLQPRLEPLEGETLGADGELALGHLAEHFGALVDAILADVDVFFGGTYWPALAVGVQVHYPAVGDDQFDRHGFVQGHPHYFVREESGRDGNILVLERT